MDPSRLRTEGVSWCLADATALDAAPCVTFDAPQSGRTPTRRAASVFTAGRWIYALVHTWMVQLTRAPPPQSHEPGELNYSDPGLRMDLMCVT